MLKFRPNHGIMYYCKAKPYAHNRERLEYFTDTEIADAYLGSILTISILVRLFPGSP